MGAVIIVEDALMMCETLAAVSLIAATITASPCGQCHRVQASRFSETGMANALVTVALKVTD